MCKTLHNRNLKSVMSLLIISLILVSPIVALMQASNHWARIVTTKTLGGVMKPYAIALDSSGDVNIIYKDKTLSSTITYPYFNLIIMAGDTGAVVGGYSYPYYFQNSSAGEPVATVVNDTLVYIVTDGGFLAIIDKNQLTIPKTYSLSVNKSQAAIRDVRINGNRIYLLVNDVGNEAVYVIALDSSLNVVESLGWGENLKLKGTWLDIKGNWVIVSAVDSNQNAILIIHDLSNKYPINSIT